MLTASLFVVSAAKLPVFAQNDTGNTITFGDHKYAIYNDGKTWEDAKKACEDAGGHLATITSQEEQDTIKTLMEQSGNKNSYWLGGHRATEDTDSWYNWKWITGEKFEYTHWGARQPDNHSGEDCLMIYKERNPNSWSDEPYSWNDLCNEGTFWDESFFGLDDFGYICEWDEFSPTVEGNTGKPFNSDLFVYQGSGTTYCVVSSATMMIRNKLYQANDQSYRNVSFDSVKAVALKEDGDMRWSYNYNVDNKRFHIQEYHVPKSTIPKERLIEELNKHPEGIVFYAYGNVNGKDKQHAVLLTRYTNGVIYSVDPGESSCREVPLENSDLANKYFGGYENLINNYAKMIWYISGSNVYSSVSGVSLSTYNIVLSENGQSYRLSTSVLPANATNKNVRWTSSNESVATVDGSGLITPHKAGTAKITVTTEDGNKTATCNVTVTKTQTVDSTSQNMQTTPTTKEGLLYLYIGGDEVKVVGCEGKKKSITIPSTITIGGKDYRVTVIGENAFAKNNKLESVTIGDNVTTIEKKAFYKCKKLKYVNIKTKNLGTVGKQAFKSTPASAKYYCPNKKLVKKYKKKLKKGGASSFATYTNNKSSSGGGHKF